MVGAVEGGEPIDGVFGAVGEAVARDLASLGLDVVEIGFEGEAAEGKDCCEVLEEGKFIQKIGKARLLFVSGRFVVGRDAFDGGG